ncbi:MAG: hypothetical protein ACYTFG_13650, partial [Planctomycetota bacterium]
MSINSIHFLVMTLVHVIFLLFLLLVLILLLLLVLAKGKEKGNAKEPRFKVQGTSEKGQGQQPRRFCVTVVAAGKTKPS